MNFLNHHWLWSILFLLPCMALLMLRGRLRRRKLLREYFGGGVKLSLSPAGRLLRAALLTGAVLFLLLAAARPWWGEQLLDIPVKGKDVLTVFDVSKSMLAQDVAPSRLEHAKWMLRELIRKNPADRFGIIAFAGRAFFSCPLTSDRVSLEQCIAELNTELVPVGGTNLAAALETAMTALKAAAGQDKCIVLMTDGEELYGSVGAVLDQLKKSRIELLTVGLGDPSAPALIPEPSANGQSFKRDSAGELVRTRLNEALLKEITAATGGIYCNSTAGDTGLERVDRRLKELDTSGEQELKRLLPKDRFMIFLATGVGLLALWFLVGETPSRRRSAGGSGVLPLLLLLLVSPMTGRAESAAAPETPQTAENADRAASPPEPQPQTHDPVTLYNQARELQLAGHPEQARKLYEAAIAQPDSPAACEVSMHNLGIMHHQRARSETALAMQTARGGDLDGALQKVSQAEKTLDQAENWYIDTFAFADAASGADSGRKTALAQQMLLKDREALARLKKALEELKKQQEEARRKTRQAQQQNQQQAQQNQQNQQQNQQDQQQGQQNQKDQQNHQGQQNRQDQQNQQGQQNRQDQQNQQGQQNRQDQQNQQNQQGQQDQQQNQQGQQNQQDQQNQQGQQNQQNQQQQNQQGRQDKERSAEERARQAVQEARDAADKLQNSAEKMEQKSLSEQARKAREALEKAADKQRENDYAGAQKHLDEAMRDLGRPETENSDRNENSSRDKDAQSAEDSQKNNRDDQTDAPSPAEKTGQPDRTDDSSAPAPAPAETGEQGEQKMDEKQADALLDLMSQDEKLLRDAIKHYRNRRVRPVEKDW